jgi:menaquinol-cytochrome c reductase iron-sulfur subunit
MSKSSDKANRRDLDVGADDDRRNFFSKAAAVTIGGFITLFPAASGLFTFANPLRSRAKGKGDEEPGRLVRIAALEAVPDDGIPRQFPVIADRQDAWNRFPDEAIGAVYLRRKSGSDEVEAFNASCPHAGCFVAFQADRDVYQCPCHDSAFNIAGECKYGPSPRDLDSLKTETREDGGQKSIWVRYQDFYSGIHAKVPKT